MHTNQVPFIYYISINHICKWSDQSLLDYLRKCCLKLFYEEKNLNISAIEKTFLFLKALLAKPIPKALFGRQLFAFLKMSLFENYIMILCVTLRSLIYLF